MSLAAHGFAAKDQGPMIMNRPRHSCVHAVMPALAVALVAAMLAAPALAQSDLQPLMERLQRLERDIQTLNVQIARGAMAPIAREGAPSGPAPDPASASGINARLGAMEEEIRSVTGTFESLNHQIQQLNQRLDKVVGDLEFRLGALEGGRGGIPRASAAPAPGPVETALPPGAREGTLGTLGGERRAATAPTGEVLPQGSAKDRYNHAFGLLRQANYDRAELAFTEFLKAHPDDALAGNARYWLGETHYVRGDYLKAAEIFAENYKLDSQGAKAPDTLLKLGMSLAQLDKGAQACVTLGELRKKFPKAPDAIKSGMERERKRLSCK